MTTRLPDLADHLAETVRRTIVECALCNEPQPALPPPSDVEAERVVLGALLSGEVSIVELGDLTRNHFFLPLHRWIFEKLEHCAGAALEPSVGLLCAAAEREMVSPDFLRPELEHLRGLPWVSPPDARTVASKLLNLAGARELLERVGRIQLALRASTIDVFEAREQLRRLIA